MVDRAGGVADHQWCLAFGEKPVATGPATGDGQGVWLHLFPPVEPVVFPVDLDGPFQQTHADSAGTRVDQDHLLRILRVKQVVERVGKIFRSKLFTVIDESKIAIIVGKQAVLGVELEEIRDCLQCRSVVRGEDVGVVDAGGKVVGNAHDHIGDRIILLGNQSGQHLSGASRVNKVDLDAGLGLKILGKLRTGAPVSAEGAGGVDGDRRLVLCLLRL